ncbi:MAG: type II toxin-antitoxin system death-on-curing family toxin [Sphingobacteriaceae bacterium]|nr:MAG: type II toxin-antitoxin system death-on-curing family toxin [Sphingobacteriaceae bacterium]
MIDIKTAQLIHDNLINEFGGSKGIRDAGLLEAALARPYATFDKIDLYPNIEDKASAIFESIIINHPFMDGNKRIAYVLMRLLVLDNGFDIIATQDEKYKITILASQGLIRFEDIKQWIASRLIAD